MSRSSIHEALILQVRAWGETNREAAFLTADQGLVRATVYGGAKSKLRAHVASFHRGILYLYHDPVKNSRKVTDFDVRDWRPALREGLERSLAASALADTVLASHGGGDWERALELCDDTLDNLETADDELARHLLLRFLWRWVDLLGARPVPGFCARCACGLPPDALVWYLAREGDFLCAACGEQVRRSGESEGIEVVYALSAGARSWLRAAEALDGAAIRRIRLDRVSFKQAWRFVTGLLSRELGRRLKSWDF